MFQVHYLDKLLYDYIVDICVFAVCYGLLVWSGNWYSEVRRRSKICKPASVWRLRYQSFYFILHDTAKIKVSLVKTDPHATNSMQQAMMVLSVSPDMNPLHFIQLSPIKVIIDIQHPFILGVWSTQWRYLVIADTSNSNETAIKRNDQNGVQMTPHGHDNMTYPAECNDHPSGPLIIIIIKIISLI